MHSLSHLPAESRIAILGPKGSFSGQASSLLSQNREDLRIEEYASMRDVRNATRSGAYALLPRVNYSSGPEPDNQTALFKQPWRIRGQVLLRVEMCVGGHGDPAWDRVTDVHSKDVGLRQCDDFLGVQCPDAAWNESASTAAAIRHVAELRNPSHIAVGAENALLANGLSVWKNGASNAEIRGHDNVTDFVLVSEEQSGEPALSEGMRHHGLVITPENRPGIMLEVDRILHEHGMDKESQPEQPYALGMYRFLILFSAIDSSSDVRGVLADLQKLHAANGEYPLLKPLGSWNDRIMDPRLQPGSSSPLSH